MEADLSLLVYVLIALVLAVKLFGLGCGGTCG
jgi:hypothetical protein